jgi:hypothetical protein
MFLIFQSLYNIHTTNNLIVQGIGFIGLILVFISFQNNKRLFILLFLGTSQFFYAIHFALLGAWTAFAMNIVGMTRTFIFTQKGKKKWLDNVALMYVFIGLFWIAGALSWVGWISILPVLAMTIETIGLWMKNPTKIRFNMLSLRPLWLSYNIIYRSYAGMTTDTLVFISLLIGIVRFDIIPGIRRKYNSKKQLPKPS